MSAMPELALIFYDPFGEKITEKRAVFINVSALDLIS